MVEVALLLSVALAGGLLARLVRLPPMVGFLAAGFTLAAFGVRPIAGIDTLADLGVTLLLFAVGLKLDVSQLIKKEVWLTATAHAVVMLTIGWAALGVLALVGVAAIAVLSPTTLALLAFAFSFSSTVFAVKVLEERSESRSRYGQITIGILVIQDLMAVAFLVATTDQLPSPWALALLLLIPARPIIGRIWQLLGHGELQILFGVTIALVPGYFLFDLVGLKGDLGAVAMGLLLASDPRSGDLQKALFSVKELLLIAFFLAIGLQGLPTMEQVGLAVGLVLLLLPIQTAAYVLLISWFGMRRRTATLTALALANNSEFGLIVAATAVSASLLAPSWLGTLSVAVAVGFLVSTLLNVRAEALADWVEQHWPDRDPSRLDPHERPIPLHQIDALVLGMGRIGTAAYRRLNSEGLTVLGVEHDELRADHLADLGLRVVAGDATDNELWRRLVAVRTLRTVVLAMPFHHANVDALRVLKARNFSGSVVAVARFDDEVDELLELGADSVLDLYGGSGLALAESALGRESTVEITRIRNSPG